MKLAPEPTAKMDNLEIDLPILFPSLSRPWRVEIPSGDLDLEQEHIFHLLYTKT